MQLSKSFAALAGIVLLSLSSSSSVSAAIVTDASTLSNTPFDIIIVGGGLAGLTVANRVSADPNVRVLVIEAGNDDRSDPNIYNVDNYGKSFGTSQTFAFDTVTQVGGHSKGVGGGRTLGGSTSINGAAWNRASRAQYDALGPLMANSTTAGWDWDGLLAYMRKSENFVAPNQQQQGLGARWDASVHGTSGPLEIAFSQIRSTKRSSGGATQQWKRMFTGRQQPAFIQAVGEALGVQHVDDQCSGQANSVAYTPNSIGVDGRRTSSASAYYTPVQDRANLTVLTGTMAKSLLWSSASASLRSTGVVVQQGRAGSPIQLTVNKEVILAAGALNTPTLLQRSGVGAKSDLDLIGVDTRISLPGVGKNLQDQTMTTIGSRASIDTSGGGPSAAIAMPNVEQIMANATDVRSYISSNLDSWAATLLAQGHIATKQSVLAQWNSAVSLIFDAKAPVAEFFFDTGFPANSYGIDIWQLLPFSRGSIRATSQNPFDAPRIDPNYFGLPIDMDMQVASLRAGRRVLQNSNLETLTYNGETTPGFALIPDGTHSGRYSRWQSWILGNTPNGGSGYAAVNHHLGTAAMGSRQDGGVVDAQFKVYGTENVRVVDASVLPVQVSAHLSATLYGVAEKAADAILGN
ncbi:related to Glucose oxidase [Sporisorium reilianum SRZ2]|uniref:Related to Glucose oxidase n=1 Tax=Sporisorium reilianum (strain SRZ2) TaxID=999809 RepID=E7A333_SPORE|nr:related to Glucose oxidase [Sporisorium reilianum SRZ2]